MAPYVITNTLIAIFIVILASSKNYLLYVKPAVKFISVLKKIVTEHDLTNKIINISRGEIGEIERYFNLFTDEIQTVMRNISSTTQTLNKSSADLSCISGSMAEASKETNSKTGIVNSTIESIAASLEETAAALSEASSSMRVVTSSVVNMSNTTVNLASVSQQTSVAVGQVADIAGHMSGSINSVSESARDVSASVNSVATAVKEISISLNEIRATQAGTVQSKPPAFFIMTDIQGNVC